MTKTLDDFYIELQDWLDAGMPNGGYGDKAQPFCRNFALCAQLAYWTTERNIFGDLYHALDDEQARRFIEAYDCEAAPFTSTVTAMFSEAREGRAYQNPKRLAYIAEQAKLAKERRDAS